MENIYHDYWQQELMYQFLVEDKCKKKAYVCSPYSAENNEGMLQNMRTARAYMFYALKKMGMCARAPHAFLPMLLCDSVPSERAIALKFGMLIAIDHGNFAIKTVNHSFVAGLAEHTVKPPMTDEVLEYGGKFWTLSGKRLNYMKDKTNDERYFILTLIAIAKELESAGRNAPFEQVQLAVGLPPEHYGVLKNKFANYFKKDGAINFIYKEKPFSIIIDKVMVFPQAYAAVVPQSSMIVNTPRIFIVDIGGYTTDVLLLKNGKLDFQFCRSLESGVITMNNEIIRKVNSYHDMLLEDEHISDVLCGKDIFLPEDVVETIKGATKQHASNILNQLRELQVDLRSNPAIFVGGGSILLRPFLENSPMVMRGSFVDSPNANAVGYEMLGRTQMLRPNA